MIPALAMFEVAGLWLQRLVRRTPRQLTATIYGLTHSAVASAENQIQLKLWWPCHNQRMVVISTSRGLLLSSEQSNTAGDWPVHLRLLPNGGNVQEQDSPAGFECSHTGQRLRVGHSHSQQGGEGLEHHLSIYVRRPTQHCSISGASRRRSCKFITLQITICLIQSFRSGQHLPQKSPNILLHWRKSTPNSRPMATSTSLLR